MLGLAEVPSSLASADIAVAQLPQCLSGALGKLGNDLASQHDWGQLGEYDSRRLLGRTHSDDWALLRRMRGAALGTVFGPASETIQNVVLKVVTANDDAFPQLAFESYEELYSLDGVGEGIAMRLLTLARPDRFVSLNSGSRVGLAKLAGRAPSTLRKPQNYSRLLTTIYDQEWHKEPTPRNARERAISRMRTALLDFFVYVDQHST